MLAYLRRPGLVKRLCLALITTTLIFIIIGYEVVSRTDWQRRLPKAAMSASATEKGFKKPDFHFGKLREDPNNYTRILVVARTRNENTDWINQELPGLQTAVYVADDDSAQHHPPANKGHEAMIYLSYLIDYYDMLPDVSIFMHAHRWAWHNAELLNFDSVQVLQRMRTEKVVHDGYVNTRCQWGPGCPDWIKPKKTEHEIDKPEQGLIAKAWGELFPYEDVPDVLSQPCCSQFALSKDRILSIPRERLIYIRDWLLHTDLDDSISGRIFEYTWQALFTNQNVFCPKPHICWCETYGLCFESEQQYNEVEGLRMSMDNKRNQLGAWRRQKEQFDDARTKGDIKTMALLQMPEPGRDLQLMGELNDGAQRLAQARVDAIVRGEHFKYEPKD